MLLWWPASAATSHLTHSSTTPHLVVLWWPLSEAMSLLPLSLSWPCDSTQDSTTQQTTASQSTTWRYCVWHCLCHCTADTTQDNTTDSSQPFRGVCMLLLFVALPVLNPLHCCQQQQQTSVSSRQSRLTHQVPQHSEADVLQAVGSNAGGEAACEEATHTVLGNDGLQHTYNTWLVNGKQTNKHKHTLLSSLRCMAANRSHWHWH